MARIFLVLAGLNALALLVAVLSGTLSWFREGLMHPEEPSYLIHFVVGLTAVVGNLLVHCLVITYFLGTGRLIKEVTLAYQLPDERWARPTRDIKRGNTPYAIVAMLLAIATAAAGSGRQFQVWPAWIHLTLATIAFLGNLWVFRIEYRNLTRNIGILDEIMVEVERIRAEHGLPSSEEAFQRRY